MTSAKICQKFKIFLEPYAFMHAFFEYW